MSFSSNIANVTAATETEGFEAVLYKFFFNFTVASGVGMTAVASAKFTRWLFQPLREKSDIRMLHAFNLETDETRADFIKLLNKKKQMLVGRGLYNHFRLKLFRSICKNVSIDNCSYEIYQDALEFKEIFAADRDTITYSQFLTVEYLGTFKESSKKQKQLHREFFKEVDAFFPLLPHRLEFYQHLNNLLKQSKVKSYRDVTLETKMLQLETHLARPVSIESPIIPEKDFVFSESKEEVKPKKEVRLESIYVEKKSSGPVAQGGDFLLGHYPAIHKRKNPLSPSKISDATSTSSIAAKLHSPASIKKDVPISTGMTLEVAPAQSFSPDAHKVSNNAQLQKKDNLISLDLMHSVLGNSIIFDRTNAFLGDGARLVGSAAFKVAHRLIHGDKHPLLFKLNDIDFVSASASKMAQRAHSELKQTIATSTYSQFTHKEKVTEGGLPYQLTVKDEKSENSIVLSRFVISKNTAGDFRFLKSSINNLKSVIALNIKFSLPAPTSPETLFLMRIVKLIAHVVIPGPYRIDDASHDELTTQKITPYLSFIAEQNPKRFKKELVRFLGSLQHLFAELSKDLQTQLAKVIEPILVSFFAVLLHDLKADKAESLILTEATLEALSNGKVPVLGSCDSKVYLIHFFDSIGAIKLASRFREQVGDLYIGLPLMYR